MKQNGDAMAPKAIADLLDEPVNNVQKLLLRMAEVGEIVKVEYGRYALPPLHPPSE